MAFLKPKGLFLRQPVDAQRRPRSVRVALLCSVLLFGGVGSANAATFHIRAGDDGDCANTGFDLTSTGAIAPIYQALSANCTNGSVSMAANAGTGFLGVRAQSTSVLNPGANTYDTLFASSVARVTTQFIVEGPSGTIPVSLNLSLDSKSSSDAGGRRRLFIFTSPFGLGDVRVLADGSIERLGSIFIPDVDCEPCDLSTEAVLLPANTVLDFVLQLGVDAVRYPTQAAGTTGVDALDTLSFPSGPVFNLPAGHTASIFGMNVVDNEFARPVPEPSTWALWLLGLPCAGVWIRREHRSFKRSLELPER